jgi:hypothetical protein
VAKTEQKVVLFRDARTLCPAAPGLTLPQSVAEVISLMGDGWRVVRLSPADGSSPAATTPDAYALAVLEREVA